MEGAGTRRHVGAPHDAASPAHWTPQGTVLSSYGPLGAPTAARGRPNRLPQGAPSRRSPERGRLSTNGRQSTNAYDLRPFFGAVEGLARLDGLLPTDDAAPLTPATSDNESCNYGPCDDNNSGQRNGNHYVQGWRAMDPKTPLRPTRRLARVGVKHHASEG